MPDDDMGYGTPGSSSSDPELSDVRRPGPLDGTFSFAVEEWSEDQRVTVSELAPGGESKRIVIEKGNGNYEFHDGVVREVKCLNSDEDIYEVRLYQPVYKSEKVIYPKGSDTVTTPGRMMGDLLAGEGGHEQEMEERKPDWGA
ncbi:hypothetical protein [Streptomyces sp. NPDC097981]|uniref:hypothetical protein n=1 Tax=Streptomyces sp. NPDC097981 TaxID=3155428 RepID=UPI0033277CD9